MRNRRDKGCFRRIQFFKFGDILQQNNIAQIMGFIRIGIRIHNGNIGCLKIAFLIIRINLQRLFLLARID